MFKLFFNKNFRKLYKESFNIVSILKKDKEIFQEEIKDIAITKIKKFSENNNINPNQIHLAIELAIYKYYITTSKKKP
jgi:hypothetical protein